MFPPRLDLSVVIPTVNRPAVLRRVLDALAHQDAPDESFEVIVVIDPQDPDPPAVEAAISRRAYPVRSLLADAAGASAARNLGWRSAHAELILFIDDDILPSPQLISEHVRSHQRFPGAEIGVLGSVRWARGLRVTAFMRWLERGIQFDYQNIVGDEAGWSRFYSANASVKRSLLRRAGGFDAERLPFGYEDLDLAYRMTRFGFRLLYNRRATAEHWHPMDLDFWQRRVRRIAVAEHEFVRLHPEIRPYFHQMFEQAARRPPSRGRGVRLAGVVPRWVPWLGPRVWRSADIHYRQALAPNFLAAWNEATVRPGRESGPDLSEREGAR